MVKSIYESMNNYAMETSLYVRNPLWIEALAGEEQRAPLHNKRSDNNWKKGLLSIAIFGLLLAVLGVQVYGLVTSAGSSAILAAGLLSDSAIATALLAFMSSPPGWGVMIFIGSVIVGF